MNALKKITSILTGIFYLCAAASMVFFALCRLTDIRWFFETGNAQIPFWLLNPAPLLALFLQKRSRLIPVALWLLCGIALVALTGGV